MYQVFIIGEGRIKEYGEPVTKEEAEREANNYNLGSDRYTAIVRKVEQDHTSDCRRNGCVNDR